PRLRQSHPRRLDQNLRSPDSAAPNKIPTRRQSRCPSLSSTRATRRSTPLPDLDRSGELLLPLRLLVGRHAPVGAAPTPGAAPALGEGRAGGGGGPPLGVRPYLTATSFGQPPICTRHTSRYLPSSGLKIEASPSFTSNQSLPRASMMLGLCVMRKVFLPFSGTCASILRSAMARRLFSSSDTMRPPSVRSVVFSMSLNPASTAVSKARLKLLV